MQSRATHALRCDSCGDVIGVYEPAIVIDGAQTRETSLAAEPRRSCAWERSFHRGCFDAEEREVAGAPAAVPRGH